jgi:hypothetical protein
VALEHAETFEAIGRGNFTAQVDEVIDAKPAGGARLLDGSAEREHVLAPHVAFLVEPDAERVEYGGDTRSGDLRIVLLDRRSRCQRTLGRGL